MNQEDKYLIDTDIIIYWLKNKYPEINERMENIGDHQAFVSSITVAELYYGVYYSSRPEDNH